VNELRDLTGGTLTGSKGGGGGKGKIGKKRFRSFLAQESKGGRANNRTIVSGISLARGAGRNQRREYRAR